MTKRKTALEGVYIIEPEMFGDHRGWFTETWSKRNFEELGLYYDFVQDNHSFSSKKGTLRGLHFQKGEYSQAKLVRCVRGSILDVAVDLRHESFTFKKWVAVELSAGNHRELLIPRGFAHGFLVLSDVAEFCYKVTDFYHPNDEGGLSYKDPDLKVEWPIEEGMILTISEKDLHWGSFAEYTEKIEKNTHFFKSSRM